jgi:uncharacterized protein (TIGR02266 family)
VSPEGERRVEALEQELSLIRAELVEVRRERDELAARLAAAATPPTINASVRDTSDVDDAGPVSLSGLVVQVSADAAADERRRQPRHGCEIEVEFLGDSHLITGLSQDISEGGVFIATYQALPIGSQVTLGLELPDGRVEVQGVVRWARPELEECEQRPGFGVAFTNLSPDALAALTAFCRSEPPHYYEM